MNKIVLVLSLFVISCSNNAADKHKEEDHKNHEKSVATETPMQLNNGAKWNADEATRKNVGTLMQIMNESNNAGIENRERVSAQLQSALDTLVQECKMKGPDHDALHVWLETVLKDVKELRLANDQQYPQVWVKLRGDIERFHDYFA